MPSCGGREAQPCPICSLHKQAAHACQCGSGAALPAPQPALRCARRTRSGWPCSPISITAWPNSCTCVTQVEWVGGCAQGGDGRSWQTGSAGAQRIRLCAPSCALLPPPPPLPTSMHSERYRSLSSISRFSSPHEVVGQPARTHGAHPPARQLAAAGSSTGIKHADPAAQRLQPSASRRPRTRVAAQPAGGAIKVTAPVVAGHAPEVPVLGYVGGHLRTGAAMRGACGDEGSRTLRAPAGPACLPACPAPAPAQPRTWHLAAPASRAPAPTNPPTWSLPIMATCAQPAARPASTCCGAPSSIRPSIPSAASTAASHTQSYARIGRPCAAPRVRNTPQRGSAACGGGGGTRPGCTRRPPSGSSVRVAAGPAYSARRAPVAASRRRHRCPT